MAVPPLLSVLLGFFFSVGWKYQQPLSHQLCQMLAVMPASRESLRQIICPESTG